MKLIELSAEYNESALLCRRRIAELNRTLSDEPMCEIDQAPPAPAG